MGTKDYWFLWWTTILTASVLGAFLPKPLACGVAFLAGSICYHLYITCYRKSPV